MVKPTPPNAPPPNGGAPQVEFMCPCGVDSTYENCCGRVHAEGAGLGIEAELLLRARYSAYVIGHADFLLATWHPSTRPESISFDDIAWRGLEIIGRSSGGGLDIAGVVEFKTRFIQNNERFELHERSSFSRLRGDWFYVKGDQDLKSLGPHTPR